MLDVAVVRDDDDDDDRNGTFADASTGGDDDESSSDDLLWLLLLLLLLCCCIIPFFLWRKKESHKLDQIESIPLPYVPAPPVPTPAPYAPPITTKYLDITPEPPARETGPPPVPAPFVAQTAPPPKEEPVLSGMALVKAMADARRKEASLRKPPPVVRDVKPTAKQHRPPPKPAPAESIASTLFGGFEPQPTTMPVAPDVTPAQPNRPVAYATATLTPEPLPPPITRWCVLGVRVGDAVHHLLLQLQRTVNCRQCY